MITYTAVEIPKWKKIDGAGPDTVSFFGSIPTGNYKKIMAPSIEINDGGRITYQNYFFGKFIKTSEEAKSVAERLNKKV